MISDLTVILPFTIQIINVQLPCYLLEKPVLSSRHLFFIGKVGIVCGHNEGGVVVNFITDWA